MKIRDQRSSFSLLTHLSDADLSAGGEEVVNIAPTLSTSQFGLKKIAIITLTLSSPGAHSPRRGRARGCWTRREATRGWRYGTKLLRQPGRRTGRHPETPEQQDHESEHTVMLCLIFSTLQPFSDCREGLGLQPLTLRRDSIWCLRWWMWLSCTAALSASLLAVKVTLGAPW